MVKQHDPEPDPEPTPEPAPGKIPASQLWKEKTKEPEAAVATATRGDYRTR